MDEDDYELMPHREIERLKKEISQLKKKGGVSLETIKISMDNLQESIDNLVKALKDASEEVREDRTLNDIKERIDSLLVQNHKIAEGVIALADLISKKEAKEPAPRPMPQSPMPPPRPIPQGPMPLEPGPLGPSPEPMPPFGQESMPPDFGPMPGNEPMPTDKPRRKGLFRR